MRECPSCGAIPPGGSRFCPTCGNALSGAPPSLGHRGLTRARVAEVVPPGTVLNGRYRVLRVLGTGSFGRVYLAEDAHETGSLVAVKELLAMEFPTAEEQRDAMMWFKREVSALLTLDHPGIPAMQGYWTAQRAAGPLYLAMDYIPGKTLAELQIEYGGRVPRVQAITWGIELCGVLDYLHTRTPAMVFRDLKPSNVLIDSRSQRPVLIDFGLARQLAPVAATAVGTWGYVPFEQVLGRPEPRSDLYALGALLHGLISGQQPDAEYRRLMRGGLDLDACLHQLFQPLEDLLPGVPHLLTQAIIRATAFAPADRFPNAPAMAAALQEVLENPGGLVMQGPVAGPANTERKEPPGGTPTPVSRQAQWLSGAPRIASAAGQAANAGNPADNWTGARPVVQPPEPPSANGQAPTPPTPAPVLAAEAAARLEAAAPPRSSAPTPSRLEARIMGAASPRPARLDTPASPPTPVPTPPHLGDGMPPLRGKAGASPAARVLSVTIRVSDRDSAGPGSLAAALRAAAPGSRIEVEAGLYTEPLVIDKAVEIVGLGSVADVVIEATRGTCLLMQAEHAVLRNLTLRGRMAEAGARFHTVNIPVGKALLEDCHIVSHGLACLNIHGPGVYPTLRRLVLRNAVERAIVFYDRAQALVEDCDIQGGTYPVRVTGSADPIFRRCQIHHGRFGGVWVAEHGRGEFEDCDIVDNGHHGVAVRQGGRIILTYCRVQRNGWNAVSVADTSGARIRHCDLRGNRRSAWDIRDSARRQVEQEDNLDV